MKIRQLMTSNVYTCRPDDTLTDAARIMWDKDCGALPVVDSENRVLAMITDRDICMAAYTQGVPLHAARVSTAMSRLLVTCSPETSHADLERLLREKQLRRVPVVDDTGRLIGIVTIGDLAHHAQGGALKRALAQPAVAKTLAIITQPRDGDMSDLGSPSSGRFSGEEPPHQERPI
jgi:CBS domain-containing protein